jgi:hypothetical protein
MATTAAGTAGPVGISPLGGLSTLISFSITTPAGTAALTAVRDCATPAPPEDIDDTPYSFAFTGRHDGGALPPQRTDGPYGHLVGALLEVKAGAEALMVAALAREGGAAPAPAAKRRRVEDGGGGGDEVDGGGDGDGEGVDGAEEG